MAHQNARSRKKLGRYGIKLEEFETLAIPAMTPSEPDEIVIIDEIGKMECFSSCFREALIKTLDSPNHVVASIAQRGTPFIERIKEREDVLLVTLSEASRDSLLDSLAEKISESA